jgi:hypothetical protein
MGVPFVWSLRAATSSSSKVSGNFSTPAARNMSVR